MTDRRDRPPFRGEEELELALFRLAHRTEFPPTPDLVPGVRAALAGATSSRRRDLGARLFPASRRSLSPALLAALLALLIVVGGAIAVGIGLRGLGIAFVDELPPASDELRLGERVTLGEAQASVPYRIVRPSSELSEPLVYVAVLGSAEQVSFVYVRDGEVALLLTQFAASPDMALATKLLGPGTRIEELAVAGEPAYWIEGEPHVLFYRDARGLTLQDSVRLAGDVLLWQRGELTLRLEGASSRAEAVRIAQTVE